ncbi:MAG: hypothetical protein LBH53_00670, partial [Puniceicoccales bacterium]|nr:hypothetical protein [Puniceicoccales bacterium]
MRAKKLELERINLDVNTSQEKLKLGEKLIASGNSGELLDAAIGVAEGKAKEGLQEVQDLEKQLCQLERKEQELESLFPLKKILYKGANGSSHAQTLTVAKNEIQRCKANISIKVSEIIRELEQSRASGEMPKQFKDWIRFVSREIDQEVVGERIGIGRLSGQSTTLGKEIFAIEQQIKQRQGEGCSHPNELSYTKYTRAVVALYQKLNREIAATITCFPRDPKRRQWLETQKVFADAFRERRADGAYDRAKIGSAIERLRSLMADHLREGNEAQVKAISSLASLI